MEITTQDRERSLAICMELLPNVSRTFAISILHLRGQLRTAVIVSYLLCRIADTVEDDLTVPLDTRIMLFHLLEDVLKNKASASTFMMQAKGYFSGNQSYSNLIAKTNAVIILYNTLCNPAKKAIQHWVEEMITGMKKFVRTYPQGIRVQTIEEFRTYCYYVAGTVGYLLTELWRIYCPQLKGKNYDRLYQLSGAFGEGLQTVNILKDIASDMEDENAVFIPEKELQIHGSSHRYILDPSKVQDNRKVVQELIILARDDLEKALQYYYLLPRFSFRIRRFCLLPLLFAIATLRELSHSEEMLHAGGKVKIQRQEVNAVVSISPLILWSNHSVRWLAGKIKQKPFFLQMKN